MLYEATIRDVGTGKTIHSEKCREDQRDAFKQKTEQVARSVGAAVTCEFKPREEILTFDPKTGEWEE